jgi:hypothetical protein
MTHYDIFDSLTRNAFDFLERGIAEFDKKPKYSVIHFCAAVEMLLKARLMKEHWALIVSKPDQANLTEFMAGNFKSATLEDCRTRLRDIANENIGNDAFNSFRELAKHRNKMVHFFHNGLENDEKAKARIVAEQCRSWFHLHRLLNRWKGYFKKFGEEIAQADRAMKRHRQYLATKFNALKPELEQASTVGCEPRICSACGFESAIPDVFDGQLASLLCHVCDHEGAQVQLDCPHCGESITIANEGYASCEHCGKNIEPEHVADALTDHAAAHIAIKDGDDSWAPANCGSCGGYHTVIRRGDNYFCVDCFEISDDIAQCQFCTEYNTGDMEDSYAFGCGICGGLAEKHKDD